MKEAFKIPDTTPNPAGFFCFQRRQWLYFLLPVVTLYLLQLLVIGYWRILPVSSREHDGITYVIHRGFGKKADFTSFIGLHPISGEPVYLVTINHRTGVRETVMYDLADDIYAAFPVVWPEKQTLSNSLPTELDR